MERKCLKLRICQRGMYLEEILFKLLFGLNFFYPLLFTSVILFVYAIFKQSWVWMLISGILLFPNALFLFIDPLPFKLAIFIPLIQVILTIIFRMKRIRSK